MATIAAARRLATVANPHARAQARRQYPAATALAQPWWGTVPATLPAARRAAPSLAGRVGAAVPLLAGAPAAAQVENPWDNVQTPGTPPSPPVGVPVANRFSAASFWTDRFAQPTTQQRPSPMPRLLSVEDVVPREPLISEANANPPIESWRVAPVEIDTTQPKWAPYRILEILSQMSDGDRYTQELHDLFYVWNTDTNDDPSGRAFWNYQNNLPAPMRDSGYTVNPHALVPDGLIFRPKELMRSIAAEIVRQADVGEMHALITGYASDLLLSLQDFLADSVNSIRVNHLFRALADHPNGAPYTQDLHDLLYTWNTEVSDDPVGRAFWHYNRITRDDINPHAQVADRRSLSNPSLLLKFLVAEYYNQN